MPAPTHVVIAFGRGEADQKAASSLAAGFQRDGTRVTQVSALRGVLELLARPGSEGERPDLVVASLNLEDRGDGVELVAAVRAAHDPGVPVETARPPVILVGDGERRAAAQVAGAAAFIAKPAYVKDIVTIAAILAQGRAGLEPGWGGELGALHLYYVVRALGAARRTGVLTLVRGGRRGELRFFDGEVTSAQVGSLHGQAAFHQLLLWPEAHFDLRAEKVMRRQQIPLSPAELLQDAERFLRDFHELAGGISPSALYEQDARRAAEHVEQIPKEVAPVLRRFDGLRSVADVIEDSPTRLAETLKIVKKLIALGVLRKLAAPRALADTAQLLLVDDWLVGNGPSDGRPLPIEPRAGAGAGDDALRRPRSEPPVAAVAGDWGMGAGQRVVWGAAHYAPVVPSHSAKGEISVGPPVVTAASSTDMIKQSGSSQGSAEGAEPSTMRTNGKTKPAGGDGRKAASKKGSGGSGTGTGNHKALKAVPAAEHAASPDEKETEPNRPVPVPRAKSKSGEISAPPVVAVEKEVSSGPAIEIDPEVAAVTTIPATPPPPPPPAPSELAATAPVRTTPPRTAPPAPAVAREGGHFEDHHFEKHEEAFFSQEAHFEKAEAPAAESFEDLDDGQPQPGFWKRLFKKVKR